MLNSPLRKISVGLVLLVGLLAAAILPGTVIGRAKYAPAAQANLGIVCTTGSNVGGEVVFNLTTDTGYYSGPDGNQVFMWGFGNGDATGEFQMPGPILCVNEGDTVRVNLTNSLPDPVSVVFPGQESVTAGGDQQGLFTWEAAANTGSASYSFVAGQPGTFLYESGTDPFKQVQMGLYGALIVRPAMGANFAYNNAGTQFANEFLILLHEIDPKLHAKVERNEPYTVEERYDRYWTINGRSMPDLIADNFVEWLPHQPYGALVQVEAGAALPALIRFANAGWENHPFHPHGNHMTVVARDGQPLGQSYQNFTTSIGSGQTYDLLFRWDNVEAWDTNANMIPIPMAPAGPFPDQKNVVYKDGVTFYSGNPYLGEGGATTYQDSFPPGSTIFNQCGEFYFPWHSHALDEVQNFDEGFGGMLTLVRVDPPGGCP
jgi:FtsP/CotA-like multicopper oxidase with cupredoxin domain